MPRMSEPKKTPDLSSSEAARLRVGLCQIATVEWDVAGNLDRTVADFEKRLLEDALATQRYSQRATARHLRLSYHQLRNRLGKHGLI